MGTIKCTAVLASLLCGCASALGKDVAGLDNTTSPVISAANLDGLRQVKERPLTASRLIRISDGEFIVLPRSSRSAYGALVVDERNLQTRKSLAKGQRVEAFAVAPDWTCFAWHNRGQKHHTIQREDGTQSEIPAGSDPSGVALSPDGKILAIGSIYWTDSSGGGYSETRIFDVNGKLLHTLKRNGAGSVRPVFSPSGKVLAVGNRNHPTQIFDVETGKLLRTLKRKGFNTNMTQDVVFAPDGRKIAAGYVDGKVGIWDVASGRLLQLAESGCDEVYSVDWSPNGKLLVTSGLNGPIALWHSSNLQRIRAVEAPVWVIQVRFSSDGTGILSASASNHFASADRKVILWSVRKK